MNLSSYPSTLGASIALGLIAFTGGLFAQTPMIPRETARDLNSGFAGRLAESIRNFQDPNRKVFKFDLDCDVNRDGVIGEEDNGWMEITPPGLVLKTGTLEAARLRLWSRFPYFPGEAVARLEVCGINRDNDKGEFASVEEEMNSTGHIIVWADKSKKVKLLDSRDSSKRAVEWHFTPGYIVQSRMGIPSTIYIEAVSPSGKHAGDVRLVATVQPLKNAAGNTSSKFMPSFDHLLITVDGGANKTATVSGK